ncbi:MAG TPA: aromatic ring-hydroxylating dioxygenase subunit alpha [Candidatus Tectomicrobia bacterium]|nr:aromatic ring-hydroxylating dioxygenase subunit alpha [Candidatus Tectomicrobia bacterium]
MELSRPPRDHWYIAAASVELGRRPLACVVLGEPLVLFRDADGRPAALLDRCAHRNMALSAGRVAGGCIECPYHGWRYDRAGRCTGIPAADGAGAAPAVPRVRAYQATESDGYVWVFAGEGPAPRAPFRFPHLREPGWTSFRMRTRFTASAVACLENFLDCPHTVFVHRGLFRARDARPLRARVRRYADRVEADFVDEAPARSVVSALFFPRAGRLTHTDRFMLPAISRVDYRFGPDRHFIITSQCTPVSDEETDVHTVVTFRTGRVGPLVRLLLEPICRRIIRQDVLILARQTAQLRGFGGPRFTVVETDLFVRHINALWRRAASPAPDAPPAEASVAAAAEVETEVGIRF